MSIESFGEVLPTPRRNLVVRKAAVPSSTPRVKKPMQFEVWIDVKTKDRFIAKAGDKERRRLFIGTRAECMDKLSYQQEEIEAIWADVKARDNVGEDAIRSKTEVINDSLGYDITPEFFLKRFPFRGVEFGKWQDDRQGRLNKAALAFDHLSFITGLIGADLTLNIGLAFGARGTGKAAAHWERDTNCINLTKTAGAGCAGHEWFHAYDLGGGDELSSRIPYPKSFQTRCLKADASRGSKKYWCTTLEQGARCFEQWVKYKLGLIGIRNDYLVNITSIEQFTKNPDCYPYLLEDETVEVYAFFDHFFGG